MRQEQIISVDSVVVKYDLNFFAGKPFIMHNLISFKPDGRAANLAYGRIVLPMLLQHACYPIVLMNTSHSPVINTIGDSMDFFTQVALVRYRSRRDFLVIFTSAALIEGIRFKFESIDQTLATPLSPMLFVDGRFVVSWLFLAAALIAVLIQSRTAQEDPSTSQKNKKHQ